MGATSDVTMEDGDGQDSRLLALPAELMLQCISYLAPLDLVNVSETCRVLHKAASTDLFWQYHVNANLPISLTSPAPLNSFKSLFAAHHAYWFLPRHRLWISDSEPCGQLVVARYNADTGSIEAHAVVAERGEHTVSTWSLNNSVMIHGFDPNVQLHLDRPILKLPIGGRRVSISQTSSRGPLGGFFASDIGPKEPPRLSQEILMDCAHSNSPAGVRTSFVLARDQPKDFINEGSAVWPPLSIPAPNRTRNLSASDFASTAHRPSKHSEVSEHTFRVRRWMEYANRRNSSNLSQFAGVDRLVAASGLSLFASSIGGNNFDRRGENVTTFGTIDPAAYTPTPRKPWRGIYCGDYSGHGCEFLLVLQPEEGTEDPLPERLNWLNEWLNGERPMATDNQDVTARTYTRMNEILTDMAERDGFRHRANAFDEESDEETDEDEDDWEEPEGVRGNLERQTSTAADSAMEREDIHSGRLVAIKLTGDPHVPRGQITFIAPDLGDKGLVRTAEEDVFRGARVVRSAGHVANRGFIHDEYIPSQLILVSHDRLAQYWQGFGHISFYKRVDIGALIRATHS
ncbi:hypothetical protein CAC42_6736 [Sphaceloma murrayae]|uniref:F-box domain-containing protein n=1 Tax=Sphaceloma murrayae TaxID=2082308 RepID=A0A2K1QH92_9PEZI|nr:hypothetical protein CAC42_6736 [Sphaceloma murrayae]